jgi:hypothetical protein
MAELFSIARVPCYLIPLHAMFAICLSLFDALYHPRQQATPNQLVSCPSSVLFREVERLVRIYHPSPFPLSNPDLRSVAMYIVSIRKL